MKSREEKLETLLAACTRLLLKEKHYNAQVPKILEADFNSIESIVNSLTEVNLGIKVKKDTGDLA